MSTAVDIASPQWALRLLNELDAADQRAQPVAKDLDSSQLNWQPRPGAWGVGQCLDHLRITNELYLPAISDALDDRPPRRVDELKLGWLSRLFIRKFIAPNPGGTRTSAPRKIVPASHVESSVLETFRQTNQAVRALVRRAANYDVNHIRFRNPFIPLLRFTVATGLEIIVNHENRHLLQAEVVRQTPGFPR